MQLFNTLSRKLETLETDGQPVSIYVCGLTVYDRVHLGHALGFVVFDVLHRWLREAGAQVKFVRNFTDVDDRIIERARKEGVPFNEVSERYIDLFNRDVEALNLLPADAEPRATEEMDAIIALIGRLVERGSAYAARGSVYFDVRAHEGYGKLSNRTLEEMLAGTRGEVEPGKRHSGDFALWKARKEDEPHWDSPWGEGRPGWHIECSAMARKHLGNALTICGGGLDLVFPHHENGLAQSEAAWDERPVARFWVHNGLLNMPSGEKMSKSLGNWMSLEDALKRYSADALRLWVMGSHYRAPTLFSEESMAAAERAVQRLREALAMQSDGPVRINAEAHARQFREAMDNDLNTPAAVAAAFDLRREIGKGAAAGEGVAQAQAELRRMCSILGLTLEERRHAQGQDALEDAAVEELLRQREAARAERRFADADGIRDRLLEAGIELRDTAQGTDWRRASG